MEMSTLHVYISFILLSQYKLLLAQNGETTLELSFAANPVLPGSQAVLQCKVWGDIPKEQVGISRYNNNGMNTVVFRNGNLLQDGPEHFSLDIFPDDGSTSYHVTVAGVDRVTDGGMYSCYVLDEEGGLQAISATKLEVTPQHLLPICLSSEGKVTYITESEITLTCTAQDATSTVSKMQWIRDDEINVPTNQSTTREGNTVITTLTKTLSKTDDGASFKCILLTEDLAVLSGRECSIGPITVQSSNDTVKVSRIAGLSVTVFIIVIVFACVAFIACAIVLIVCCLRCCCNQSSSISRSSSKSYSMTGISSRGESTIRREGTLTGGRESYHPARPAPPPPSTSTQQPNGDVSQDNITPDRPLSAVEAALLLTISQSLARNQKTPYNPRGNSSATDTEIIYANTNELNAIPEEENDDHGVVNPAYVGSNGPALFMVKQPTRQPMSLSAPVPQQQTEYYNTMELAVMSSSDKSSLQIDNKPKPVPLPKPTDNGISDKPVPIPKPTSSASPLRPIPVAKPRTSAPPSKPVPVAKPVINPNDMPIRPVPVLKPVSNDISTRPVPPSKPIKMVNEVSANAARPDAAPVPPPKPTYEITEDRPVNMVKMVNEVNSANAARPAAAPVPPPKPTYDITEDRPVKRVNEVSPNAARPAAAPVPPPKPTYEITEGRPVPPLKQVSKPTVDISESRPAPPPKPLPKPTSEIEDNRPAPPPKPTYEI